MNKDLLDQIPAEEQPTARKLSELVEELDPSQPFQWELENQLMNKATTQPAPSWLKQIMIPFSWVVATIGGVILLSWVMRSLIPQPSPAAEETPTEEISFADSVRTGTICAAPLALSHGFAVFLSNPEKNEFVMVDTGSAMSEVRSFAWSPDGEQIAIIGNSMGRGVIYLTRPGSSALEPLLSDSDVGYLMEVAWSQSGEQLVLWSSQNNQILYVFNRGISDLVEMQLDIQILGNPQFMPAGESILLYGSNVTSGGLFEVKLDDGQASLRNPRVEDEDGFAFSPDGSRLAYVEMDRERGQARVMVEEIASGDKIVLGTLPIPQGTGSTIPKAANLSWSNDGTFLVFDFGQFASQRAIYLAPADGSGLIQLIESGYAPAISPDGKCLAYIQDKQVFLFDLAGGGSRAMPVLLADLPARRNTPDLDKLQWSPGP